MTKHQLYPALQVANDLKSKIRLIPIRPITLKNRVFLSGVPRQDPQWRQIAKVSNIDQIIFGAFIDQRLPCVDKSGLPLPIPTTPSEFRNLHVSELDINKLLFAAGYRMIWEPKAKRTSRKISTQEISWKLLIQIEATARCKRLYISGANPSKTDLADSMASLCKEQNIKTNTGSFPSKGYIRTHVLGGRQWKFPPKP